MKKFYFISMAVVILFASPVMAATKAPVKAVWKPITPIGYTPITWVSSTGIASYYRAPANNGSLDFITRIYLPENQIGFITATSSPIDLGEANPNFIEENSEVSSAEFRNLSYERLGAEFAKGIAPTAKFIWDAPFFNMKNGFSDLSMAVKYRVGTTTIISSGARSVPDMALDRRMLIINNQKGTSSIGIFDSRKFVNSSSGDVALEGFSPTVAKNDSAAVAAARLFIGVSNDGKELVVYCSYLATVGEASKALTAAGISIDHQLEADGGGSASCGYNLPGQYFVEPTRTLPALMGAVTLVGRGNISGAIANVRKGPSTKDGIVSQLKKGEAVYVYEEKNGWYRIGDKRWVIKTLIKVQ